jgi:dephospho-CoA kinase
LVDRRDASPNSSTYTIGLTGNIATGKTTVGRMLEDLGAECIDADQIAHEVIEPDGPAYEDVIEAFGPEILRDDRSIDRRRLGRIVFNDDDALRMLEAIVHPPVIRKIDALVERSEAPAVVVEAIKLLESGMAAHYDAIWVTTCAESTQRSRLMTLRGMSCEEAEARLRAQTPQSLKLAQADVVIETDGTIAQTRAQVRAAWQRMPLAPQSSGPEGHDCRG